MKQKRKAVLAFMAFAGCAACGGGEKDVAGETASAKESLRCSCDDMDSDTYCGNAGCGPQDCNDADSSVFPGAREVACDSVDNDCDGLTDSTFDVGRDTAVSLNDRDSDGTPSCGGLDCDDLDPERYPGRADPCNGVDDDCDGAADEDFMSGPCTVTDPPGLLGPCAGSVTVCAGVGGESCPQSVFPAAELCDGTDNNCNGVTDTDTPGHGDACDNGQMGVCLLPGTMECPGVGGPLVCNAADGSGLAGPETCDAQDDDCDGDVDDPDPGPLCPTDANPCNGTEACLGVAGCGHVDVPADGSACSDGSRCSVDDHCAAGVCTATSFCGSGTTCNETDGVCEALPPPPPGPDCGPPDAGGRMVCTLESGGDVLVLTCEDRDNDGFLFCWDDMERPSGDPDDSDAGVVHCTSNPDCAVGYLCSGEDNFCSRDPLCVHVLHNGCGNASPVWPCPFREFGRSSTGCCVTNAFGRASEVACPAAVERVVTCFSRDPPPPGSVVLTAGTARSTDGVTPNSDCGVWGDGAFIPPP